MIGKTMKQIAGIAVVCVLLNACGDSDEAGEVQRQFRITVDSPAPLELSFELKPRS